MLRMGNWSPLALVALAAVMLAGCGGHGGGGGGGGSAATLRMTGFPAFGTRTGTGATATNAVTTFNLTTASASTQVGGNDFTAATTNQVNYIEIPFSAPLLASSIKNTLNNGTSGIVIRKENGDPVNYDLDLTGAIDATNAAPASGQAPALLRLYINESTFANVNQFPAGQYKIAIIPQNLFGANGQPFCVQTSAAGGCLQSPSVLYSFTVGGDATAPTAALSGASLPVVNAQIDTNSEIRLFFSEAIDFQSIANVTTAKDKFVSAPFPLNNLGAQGTTLGENIAVAYTPPAGTGIGPNRGFIVYMPDPFHNPTEVRVRMVDISNLTATDGVVAAQNYGLDSTVYTSAGQVPPVNFNNQTLSLPPILPLPGSTASGTATLQITLFGTGNNNATDTSNNADGSTGVTDRAANPATNPASRNALQNDIVIAYTVKQGPQVGNNPSPPDVTFIVNNNTVNAVSSGKLTNNGTPAGVVVGGMNKAPVQLSDINTLGTVLDMEFGQYVNFNGAGNFTPNAPRRITNPLPITDNNGDPAIPFPQGGQPEASLCQGNPNPPPPTPAIGTFLYVVDGSHSEVRVFDSNSYTLLTTIVGVPKPGGLGADPNYLNLYVSNIDQGTVQRVNLNPFQPTFHTVLNTVTVGAQPRGISVMPANEDVFVINSGDNSVSIIDVPLQTERTRLTVGLGPKEVLITGRFNCQNCTLAYMAFVTNFFDNTVSVYESDSADPRVNNGPQGKIIDTLTGYQGPAYGCWNRSSAIAPVTGMGVIIANSLGTSAEDRGSNTFGLSPQPGFQGPAGFRTFATQHTYSTNTQSSGPADCVIDNMTSINGPNGFCGTGNSKLGDLNVGGLPTVLFASYPGSGTVVAYDFNTGTVLGSVGVTGSLMYSYFDQ